MNRVLFLICFLTALGSFAQQSGTVRGTILDEEMNGQPMQMANIMLKGTSHNVQSNFFGDFEINDIEPGRYDMLISFAGYETVSVPLEVRPKEVIEIHQGMVAETITIDELFELSETTGSTTKVDSDMTKSDKEE